MSSKNRHQPDRLSSPSDQSTNGRMHIIPFLLLVLQRLLSHEHGSGKVEPHWSVIADLEPSLTRDA